MAPAALLCSAGAVHALCQSTASSSNVWLAKRSVSSGSALNRPSAEAKVEASSVKACLPASIYDSRRRLGLRQVCRSGPSRHVFTAAVEGNVAVEEPSTESEVVEIAEDEVTEVAAVPEESPAPATTPQRKGRNRRGNARAKREEPTVPLEAVVPGAVFMGKVTTIQPFGAFVNFGAFTDGLVHISKLSSGFVSNVNDVVSVGQEVQVTVIDVDDTAGRIALSMADKEERKEGSGRQGGAVSGDRTRSQEGNGGRPVNRGKTAGRGNQANRRDEPKKSQTKLVKGQAVEGTVKNAARGGVYVLLAEEEEGFLKYTEIPGGENMAPEAGLQVGQKINATVLRIDRGRISLSMKPIVDLKNVNSTINKGAGGGATNPFEIAFRAMDLIPEKEEVTEESTAVVVADAEEEKPQEVEPVQSIEAVVEEVTAVEPILPSPAAEIVEVTKPEKVGANEIPAEALVTVAQGTVEEEVEEVTDALAAEGATPTLVEEKVEEKPQEVEPVQSIEAVVEEVTAVEPIPPSPAAEIVEVTKPEKVGANEIPAEALADTVAQGTVEEEVEEVTDALAAEGATPTLVEEKVEEKPQEVEPVQSIESVVEEVTAVEPIPPSPAAEIVEVTKPEKVGANEIPAEALADAVARGTVEEEVEEVTDALAAEGATPTFVEEKAEEVPDAAPVTEAAVPTPVEEKAEEVTEASPAEDATPAPVEENVEEVTDAPAAEAATPAPVEEKVEEVTEAPAVEAATLAPVGEKAEEVTEAPVVENGTPASVEERAEEVSAPEAAPAAEEKKGGVSAAVVKQLRDETGAGMMDCKKALADSNGNLEKAREFLRKKGLASAEKKASRIAAEGLVGSYIHDSRIGVLIEVNCETDFVSRGQAFKELVADLGMQVVASPQVKYVSVEDIPTELVQKETELEMQREDLASKPEAVRAKIVEGRVSKRLNEFVLVEQPYIRNDSILVKDLIKQTISTLGENIKVRRFERFNLGEGLEKKSEDFAAEVAAQTAKTAEAVKVEEKSAESNPDAEAAPAAPAVAVSAAVVKELRDTTGAGMMDCKKALAATDNDLQKAVQYLRKKGLASAEKKASRLASEGLIGSYIHNGVIGVLVEVNCETDFVARSETFKDLVRDVAMQIAACPLVTAVSVEDIPASYVEAERAIELGKEDLANKPEAVRSKIVEGRLNKRLSELALLEQPFIKDDIKLVKDVVKETVAALGENIQVRRFTRFNIGEGIEKKVVDFAAEVAAQTGKSS